MSASIEVTGTGRSGTIEYREDGHTIRCGWEFGGGDTVAIVCVPPAKGWDAVYPWAAGRRAEILGAIAYHTRDRYASRAEVVWDNPHDAIYLKERPPEGR